MSARACLAVVMAFYSATRALAQDSASFAHYRVSYVGDRLFNIEATFRQPTDQFGLYHFPSLKRPEGQAASVTDLVAFDERGQKTPVAYVGQGNWRTRERAASRISYRLRADHDAVSWGPGKDEVATHFDNTYFFVGNAFFLVNFNWPAQPIAIDFALPKGWRVTAPWDRVRQQWVAEGPLDLANNAFAMGSDTPTSLGFDSLEVIWLSERALAGVTKEISDVMSKLPSTYINFWGALPVRRFVMFTFADPQTDGGAFRNSFAMRIAVPIKPVESIVWSHLLGHEFMHLWNGSGRIRTAPDGSAYWFVEGVTDYLTVKLMREAGLIDDALLQQRLANFVRRFMIAQQLTPNVSLSAAGARKAEHWNLLYGGGALFGLVLDAELSAKDHRTFRDAMRAVYAEGEQPYDHQRLMTRLDKSTNGQASVILAWIDAAPDASQIRERLARFGMDISTFANDEVYMRFTACGAKNCVPPFLR